MGTLDWIVFGAGWALIGVIVVGWAISTNLYWKAEEEYWRNRKEKS